MKWLACACLAVLSGASVAQNMRYSAMYDLKDRVVSPVVGYQIGSLPRFLGTKLEPEIWGLAGVELSSQRAAIGFAAVLPFQASTNLKVYFGAAVRVQDQRPVGAGLVAGFELRL